MRNLTLGKLSDLMCSVAGDPDATVVDGTVADQPFADLGYDSLAVLAIQAKIARESGITIPDGEVDQETTPRMMLDLVNRRLAEVG